MLLAPFHSGGLENQMKKESRQKLLWVLVPPVLIFCLWASTVSARGQKLKVEEVVAKHLGSIGSAEARASIKSRLASGTAEVVFRLGGQGTLAGKGQMLSEGRKVRLALTFSAIDYPGEQIVFDGEKVNVGQVRPGQRSPFSAFLYGHDVIAREGLLGGVLSTAWPLLDLVARQPRLDYSGLKKIEGRQLHEVKYRAKKGPGDLQVTLYFDPETFRHVRTQYRLVRPAAMASSPTESPSQQDTIYTLSEVFDNFQEAEGLTLPLSFRLDLTIEGQNATIMTHWSFAVTEIAHNQQVDPKSFTIR
jgi:hypothetical protein